MMVHADGWKDRCLRYNLLSPAQKKTANCHQVVFSKASKTAYSCNRPTQGYNVYHLVVKQRAEQIQPDTPGKNTEGSWNRDGEAFSIPAKGTTMTSSAPCLTARGRRKTRRKAERSVCRRLRRSVRQRSQHVSAGSQHKAVASGTALRSGCAHDSPAMQGAWG